MRQEVERMREVMRQNYEEMRQLREQNKLMHNDVKDIKELLLKNRLQPTPRFEGTGVQRPLTASPVHMFKPAEYSSRSPAPPKGSPSPRSPNQGVGSRQLRGGLGGPYNVKQSVDPSSRALSKPQQPQRSQGRAPVTPGAKGVGQGASPPVCSMKDEPVLPLISNASSGQQRMKSGLRLSTGKGVRK